MKKKYLKVTAFVLAGMLAVNLWSPSFESKADESEEPLTHITTQTESAASGDEEGTNQTEPSNQDENSMGGGSLNLR